MNDTINGAPSNIDEAFCCLSHKSPEIINIMHFCDKNVIHFYYLPRVFGEYKLHLDAQNFMGRTVYSNHIEPLSSISNRFNKRSFDIVVSGFACLCVLPFIPIIALIIKIQSPGPIFFKQARTGLNGDTFYCLKFRFMPNTMFKQFGLKKADVISLCDTMAAQEKALCRADEPRAALRGRKQ